MKQVPEYAGLASDTSGRTFDQAPSAPTSRSTAALAPLAKATSCRPFPAGVRDVTLWPHRIAASEATDQHGAKLAPVDFRAPGRGVARLVEQDHPLLVHDALGILAGLDEAQESVVQAGHPERWLAGVLVDVEQAALPPCLRRCLRLVDRRRDPVPMQDAGERQAAKACADDADRLVHSCAPRVATASIDAGNCCRRRWPTMRAHARRVRGSLRAWMLVAGSRFSRRRGLHHATECGKSFEFTVRPGCSRFTIVCRKLL